MGENQEIQEVLGRSYGMDEVDEGELEAELDMLGDEMIETALADDATPSYVTDMASADPFATAPAAVSDPLDMKSAVPAHSK